MRALVLCNALGGDGVVVVVVVVAFQPAVTSFALSRATATIQRQDEQTSSGSLFAT